MNAKAILNFKEKLLGSLGNLVGTKAVRHHFDTFGVNELKDRAGKVYGYQLTTPAVLYRHAGGQNSSAEVELRVNMPNHQFMVDGKPHWPFEALSADHDAQLAFGDVADKIALRGFGKRMGRIHYGIMPGVFTFEDGNPVFTVHTDGGEAVLFYADDDLNMYAAFNMRYNIVKFGKVSAALIPLSLAAQMAS